MKLSLITQHVKPRKSFLYYCALVSLLVCVTAQRKSEGVDEETKRRREMAKPWYSSDTEIFGYKLPISPVTLVIGILAVLNIYRGMTKNSWAEGSHILIEGDNEETFKKLEDLKKEIGNNPKRFSKCARENSSCPSGANGGDLGRWKRGDMAPSFDKAVFDLKNSPNTTIGPVKTQFGWHLIYVRDRFVADQPIPIKFS